MGYHRNMGTLIHETTPAVATSEPGLRKPPMYRVVLLNDDFTPMDFVVDILRRFFQKSVDEATRIMLAVHHEGRGVCGIYPFEIAESKVHLVRQTSRKHGHPLMCVMERVEEDDGGEPC